MEKTKKIDLIAYFTIGILIAMVSLFFIQDINVSAAEDEYYEYCNHSYLRSDGKYYIDDVEVSKHEYEVTLSCGLTYEEFISGGTKVSSIDDFKKQLIADIHTLKTSMTYYLSGDYPLDTFAGMIETDNDDGNTDYTIFYINAVSYSSSQRDGLTRAHFEIEYNITADQLAKVQQAAFDIASKYNYGSTYDKIKNVHDYLCNTISYDKSLVNHSVYSALISKSTVCEGYAEAFDIVMSYLGIPCKIVQGNINNLGAHEWNNVKLDGQWYHIDCTWDDQESYISYSYFLIGQDRMKDDAIAATSYNSGTNNSSGTSEPTAAPTQAAKQDNEPVEEQTTEVPATEETTQEVTTEEPTTEEPTTEEPTTEAESTTELETVAETTTPEENTTDSDESSSGGGALHSTIVVIVVIVLIGCGTTAVVIIKRRQK